MAGLGAALALGTALPPATRITLLEQAAAFAEVGAGIQLGPNATRVLRDWGLEGALRSCAAFPEALRVRDARSGSVLGQLRLGERAAAIYGAPYATIHRADLHALLLDAVRTRPGVQTVSGQQVQEIEVDGPGIRLRTQAGAVWDGDVLLGCDGLWSRVRQWALGDGAPQFSGHLAYRGMVPVADLPSRHRGAVVSAWLGPRLHAVHYPVRRGEWMNVVVVVHGEAPVAPASWDHQAQAAELFQALGPVHADLADVLHAVPQWRLWPLMGRAPVRGPHEMAQGRVALLGDAAHPMRPYLAQGVAMALEDAWALGRWVQGQPPTPADWPARLQRWAAGRWQRNAWVQSRSQRNGRIFHAQGVVRLGRNWAMRGLGESLLDVPALYRGPPAPQ